MRVFKTLWLPLAAALPIHLAIAAEPPGPDGGPGDAGPLSIADISPESFSLAAFTGGSDNAELMIGNLGSADLTWPIKSTETGNAYGAVAFSRTIERLPQTGSRTQPMASEGRAPQRIDGTRFARAISGDWNENFDDVTALPCLGWSLINNSAPLGVTGWYQGNPNVFESHEGAPDSYIAANFNNTAGNGIISNWLLSPEIELQNDTKIRFWTRNPGPRLNETFEDRMQVRLSTSGNSDDVGNTATSVGEFDTLLLDINENYDVNGYPFVWTEYVLVIEGLNDANTGRVAFRYFVESGGPAGDNSNYIGIDTFSVTQPDGTTPPPSPIADPLFFTDRGQFLNATAATAASDDYVEASQPPLPLTSGQIILDTPTSFEFRNWPNVDFPDDNDIELAINGNENLDIALADGCTYAMGVDFNHTAGGSTPSTFDVTVFAGDTQIAGFRFETERLPDQDYIGVWAQVPFNRLEIRETPTANENEFFGTVSTSQMPLPSQIFTDRFEVLIPQVD